MKKFLTLFCALLGFGAMAMATGSTAAGTVAEGTDESFEGTGVYTLTPYLNEDFTDVSFTITLSQTGSVVFTATTTEDDTEKTATYTVSAENDETTIEVTLDDLLDESTQWETEEEEQSGSGAQTPSTVAFTITEITSLTVEVAEEDGGESNVSIESVAYSYTWGEGNLNDYDNLYVDVENNSVCTKLYFTYGENEKEQTVEIAEVTSDIIAAIATATTDVEGFDISSVVITLEVTTPSDRVSWGNVKLQGDRDPLGWDWYGSELVAPKYENASIAFSYNNGEWSYDVTELIVEEPEVTSGVSLDLPALKQAIIDAYKEEGYTYNETSDKLTKDQTEVDFVTDNVLVVADYLEASGNDFFTVAEGTNHASYREQSDLAHICLRGGLVFELENASTLTVEVSSTGNDPKYSDFYLVDAEGTAIEVSEISGVIDESTSDEKLANYKGQSTYVVGDGKTAFNSETTLLTVGQYATRTSSFHTTATWVLAAGTYTLYGRNSGSFTSDLRIYDITIEDASIEEPGETEIAGFLTVAMGENSLLENEETTIVVTENADGTTTVAVPDELSVSLGSTIPITMTITDLSVTFSATNGEFTNGVASFSLSTSPMEVTDIEGSYVSTADGTTFTATIEVTNGVAIAVSFTTVEPEVSDGWTLIQDGFDAEPGITGDGNNWLVFDQTALVAEYEYIALDVTVDLTATYTNFCVLLTAGDYSVKYTNSAYDQDASGNFDNFEGTENVYLVFAVSDLVEACEGITTIPFAFWGSALAVSVYGSNEYDGEIGTFYPATESTTPGSTLEDIDILPNFTNTWGDNVATYDETSNVVNWTAGAWAGCGAYFSNDGADYTGYAGISVTFTSSVDANITYEIQYTNGTEDTSVSVDVKAGEETTIYLDFAVAGITAVQQCWIQPSVETTIVVTAAEIVVTAPVITAIASVASDVEVVEVARYNLMGQKISGAEKGINIIVYSDGSAKKVLVK